jgi:hypothetical protein
MGTGFTCVCIGNIFNILFPGTIGPEELKFTLKFYDIVKKEVC